VSEDQLQDFLAHVGAGAPIRAGSEHYRFMHAAAQEAFQIVAELNTGYRSSEECGPCSPGSPATPSTSR